MTILVDEPRWWFRGRRWSHLVSDRSLDELHDFAEQLGIPRRGFQGDHYDVPEEYLSDVLAAGAQPTTSRELLRRLKAAGLRLSPEQRRHFHHHHHDPEHHSEHHPQQGEQSPP